MGMDKNIMYVISFFLGMLIFHLLKGYCGCNNVVEGQAGNCEAVGTNRMPTDIDACGAVTDLATDAACNAVVSVAESGGQACTYSSNVCTALQVGVQARCASDCAGCNIEATNTVLAGCKIDNTSQVAGVGPGGSFCTEVSNDEAAGQGGSGTCACTAGTGLCNTAMGEVTCAGLSGSDLSTSAKCNAILTPSTEDAVNTKACTYTPGGCCAA